MPERISPSPASRILEELGGLIRHLTRITGGADDGSPLTATQRLALFELADRGPLRLNELAHSLGVSAPTATRAVDALETLGYAERVADPTDRRAQRVAVTRQGRRCVAGRRTRALDAFAPAAAALSEQELSQLVALLARLRGALSEGESPIHPGSV